MKCPKCGSENIMIEKCLHGKRECPDCGYVWYGYPVNTAPKPTTAEKLYWLVSNGYGILFINYPRTGINFDEAINAAYDAAKKQDVTK
jgi:transposase-like protein